MSPGVLINFAGHTNDVLSVLCICGYFFSHNTHLLINKKKSVQHMNHHGIPLSKEDCNLAIKWVLYCVVHETNLQNEYL